MTHRDPAILQQFRGPGKCEYCGYWWPRREAAHVIAKGMGAGKQLDLRMNLVSLGGVFSCGCHAESHMGREPTRLTLLALVAARDDWRDGAQVEAQIRRLLRAPAKKDGAEVCPTCYGRGWQMRFPTGLYSGCLRCDGSGVLMRGEPWREETRRLAGS